VLDAGSGAREGVDRAFVHADEAREPGGGLVASQLDRERSAVAARGQPPRGESRTRSSVSASGASASPHSRKRAATCVALPSGPSNCGSSPL
jgi:hypothetical protein